MTQTIPTTQAANGHRHANCPLCGNLVWLQRKPRSFRVHTTCQHFVSIDKTGETVTLQPKAVR